MKSISMIMCLALFIGCGSDSSVNVGGRVDVVHGVDIAGAIRQIGEACKASFPDNKAKEAKCYQENSQKFLEILNQGKK